MCIWVGTPYLEIRAQPFLAGFKFGHTASQYPNMQFVRNPYNFTFIFK